jgi:hypothetical protein
LLSCAGPSSSPVKCSPSLHRTNRRPPAPRWSLNLMARSRGSWRSAACSCHSGHRKRSKAKPHMPSSCRGCQGRGKRSTDFAVTSPSQRYTYESADAGFPACRFNGFTAIQRT